MKYIWKDYNSSMTFVDDWLDKEAVRSTGIDNGWDEFYQYWRSAESMVLGENFWCKVIFDNETPLAVIAFGLHEGKIMVMELVVDNKLRSRGIGTRILKEFINNSKEIFGYIIEESEAVIYPSNAASQKAFEKAGYVFDHVHDDGDALYYTFNIKT